MAPLSYEKDEINVPPTLSVFMDNTELQRAYHNCVHQSTVQCGGQARASQEGMQHARSEGSSSDNKDHINIVAAELQTTYKNSGRH